METNIVAVFVPGGGEGSFLAAVGFSSAFFSTLGA